MHQTTLFRVFQHCIILGYLTVTASGLLYTLSRASLPIPTALTDVSFKMVAPYHGYSPLNMDLIAEGTRGDGTTETINLDPYFPFVYGEKQQRKRLRSFRVQGPEIHGEKYKELARQLLEKERMRGHAYESMRLSWHQWPASPEGFEALHLPEYTEVFPITEVP